MKQQIYSLHLSNKDTSRQIDTFLSFLPLNELSHLQTLILTQIEKENIIKLKSMLALSTNLLSFKLISSEIDEDEIIFILPLSNLQKLSILSLRSFQIHIQQTTGITHLTIFNYSLEQLIYQLFQYVPMLTYPNIEYISKYNRSMKNNDNIHKHNAINLEKLIIGEFKYDFKDFANFIKQIPNLKISDKSSICIYTTPYLSNTFQMEPNTITHFRTISYKSNLFDKVTNLILTHQSIIDKCQYHFPNVTSLTLISSDEVINDSLEQIDFIQYLKMTVNLSKLIHLDIPKYQKIILSGNLLELLKESSQLSSMKIDPFDLTLLYNNEELCEYLKKMIKKLNIYKYSTTYM
ncbi:unnamed protein product [Rotaria sordida]|uniref:Uncharacterized protein n=1 Tax=Rotaria sordida TaxID=392033 RepID=A0A813TTA8_9BILA|nr:unnamed protein product [Rotaria sordida]